MAKKDELKILFPEKIFALSTGGQIAVRPVPFGKLKIFTEAAAGLMLKVSGMGLDIKDAQSFKALFDVAFEETISIMGLVLDKDRAWFDTITAADGIGLLAIIAEQNFGEDSKKNLQGLLSTVKLIFQK